MVVIIGAGLAGLVSAKVLHEAGVPFFLLDARATVGGRLATTVTEDGFRLDHGFQVLLDSYPAVQRYLNLEKLDPHPFDSGALLSDDGQIWPVLHPLRHPVRGLASAFAPYAPWSDKLRLVHLASGVLLSQPDHLLKLDFQGLSVSEFLQRKHFSPVFLERFFRPFFGGVLLDNSLESSAALFQYYLRHFILGRALLPALGIAEIPRQLASTLPADSIRLESKVERLTSSHVHLTTGEILSASQTILATTEPEAARLLGGQPSPLPPRTVTVVYFKSSKPINREKLLVLPAGKEKRVRHFVQVSNIAPSLAPPGQQLLSATVLDRGGLDDASLFAAAKEEIAQVYPDTAKLLNPLRILEVPYAVPTQNPGFIRHRQPPKLPNNVHLAGDHVLHGSIQGAMESGERAARAVLKNLS